MYSKLKFSATLKKLPIKPSAGTLKNCNLSLLRISKLPLTLVRDGTSREATAEPVTFKSTPTETRFGSAIMPIFGTSCT